MGAGWAVLDTGSFTELVHQPLAALQALQPAWDQLPPDRHLRDGGRYRRRRHGCFVVDGGRVEAVAPRAHWQPLAYNALHGGIERWFEPLPADWSEQPAWPALLAALAGVAARLRGDGRWYVEAHPFRIDTTDGIGRPTPEGAHRDGVDLVAVILVARHQVLGGETRVFEAAGAHGVRFTLAQPWSVLLLDDERVIHESTPIRPAVAGQPAWRDTLVLTFRRHGFQGPGAG
ncbi:hypothetical protein CLD22_02715 [Rubrivivax gelatinosus]|nr:hypothetical protein [Rubrivivax gelatinosus]